MCSTHAFTLKLVEESDVSYTHIFDQDCSTCEPGEANYIMHSKETCQNFIERSGLKNQDLTKNKTKQNKKLAKDFIKKKQKQKQKQQQQQQQLHGTTTTTSWKNQCSKNEVC